MDYETILIRREGKVGVITLNRPDALNAMSNRLNREVREVIDNFDDDPEIHVVVITGAGRAFCAGADIKEMAQNEQDANGPKRDDNNSSSTSLAFRKKPIIAAINGLAFGGGALMASIADIRFGCENSRFRFLGVVAGRINSTWTLSVTLGMSKAKELLFSGRVVEAEEALSIGLLDRLVPSGRLLEETMEYAQMVASNAPDMVQGIKQMLHDYAGMALEDRARHESDLRSTILKPPPVKEAFKDFLKSR